MWQNNITILSLEAFSCLVSVIATDDDLFV